MKNRNRWLVVLALGLVASPILLLILSLVDFQSRLNKLRHADHARILAACRQTIAERSSYRNDNAKWGGELLYQDKVVILPPLPDSLPSAIRELHPKDVVIFDSSVVLNLSPPFRRVALVGYKSGAQQAGSLKYIDGLWLLTGPVVRDGDVQREK